MNGRPHIIGQREAQAKALVAQQLSQLTAAIFTRAAAESLTQPDEPWLDVEHFRVLAQHSHKILLRRARTGRIHKPGGHAVNTPQDATDAAQSDSKANTQGTTGEPGQADITQLDTTQADGEMGDDAPGPAAPNTPAEAHARPREGNR